MSNNARLAFSIISVIVGMLMLAYASVPLYNLFCKMTGTGGTVGTAVRGADRVGTRIMNIKFDANVDKNLPWEFKSLQNDIKIRTGENALIFYSAENKSSKDIIGTAVYNVTPHKAAQYFLKIQCFCFEEQLLKAGQKQSMPVSFYIDPDIENDPLLKEVDTITLSYSFYKVREN